MINIYLSIGIFLVTYVITLMILAFFKGEAWFRHVLAISMAIGITLIFNNI